MTNPQMNIHTIIMNSQNEHGLPSDENGILRSHSLPKMSGSNLILPKKLTEQKNLELWTQKAQDPSEFVVLELFSGAGGLGYGFQKAGFFVAAGVDYDAASVATHSYNFLSKSICADITQISNPVQFLQELDLPKVDVIIGGPPCQGFSQLGQSAIRKLGLQEYYHNILNNLYKEFVRFVEILQPKAFLMENVPAMARFHNGELVNKIVDTFEDIGYSVSHEVLNAMDYGVPQSRRRLFIQGNRLGLPSHWPTPRLTDAEIVTVRDAIEDLPACKAPVREDVMKYTSKPKSAFQKLMRREIEDKTVVYDHIIRAVRDDDQVIFTHMNEGDKYVDVPEEFRRYRSDIFKDKYSKLVWDRPSWTVTAHIRKDAYRYIHPDNEQCRMLSIREFARLQSFPDHFRFCGAPTRRMQQIGNAVPPLLAQRLATEMYAMIKNAK